MHDASATISVEARIIGKRGPATPWYVPLPPALVQETTGIEYPFRLHDLIAYLVRDEVRTFQQRQEERRLLHVLQPMEIADAASRGKIVMGEAKRPQQEINEDEAIQVALQGFVDGLYLVFVDGQQQRNLDAPLHLHAASTLLFLRLVALAGG